jgi:hypothetical protein
MILSISVFSLFKEYIYMFVFQIIYHFLSFKSSKAS